MPVNQRQLSLQICRATTRGGSQDISEYHYIHPSYCKHIAKRIIEFAGSWQGWRVRRFTMASSFDFGWRVQPQNSKKAESHSVIIIFIEFEDQIRDPFFVFALFGVEGKQFWSKFSEDITNVSV
jgi:hypothetical protein